MSKTWQSRLQAKQNRLNQKLVDNAIRLSGDITDTIVIRNKYNDVSDVTSRVVDYIDIVEMMFPPLVDIPLRVFSLDNPVPSPVAVDGVSEKVKPLLIACPIASNLGQDDLIVRLLENPGNTQPWILVLQVKDVLGTFGSRTIQWQKLQVTYYDNVIPLAIREYINELIHRREVLGW